MNNMDQLAILKYSTGIQIMQSHYKFCKDKMYCCIGWECTGWNFYTLREAIKKFGLDVLNTSLKKTCPMYVFPQAYINLGCHKKLENAYMYEVNPTVEQIVESTVELTLDKSEICGRMPNDKKNIIIAILPSGESKFIFTDEESSSVYPNSFVNKSKSTVKTEQKSANEAEYDISNITSMVDPIADPTADPTRNRRCMYIHIYNNERIAIIIDFSTTNPDKNQWIINNKKYYCWKSAIAEFGIAHMNNSPVAVYNFDIPKYMDLLR